MTPVRSSPLLVGLAWAGLAALLVVHLPAFVCQGLDPDVTAWDLVARTVLSGGVMYRDVCENNLPGMLVPHLFVRTLFGWSSVAIRIFDVLVVAGIAALLRRWLPASARAVGTPGLAVCLFGFYFVTIEWSQCQRDTWMLLPCLVALGMRMRQEMRLASSGPNWRLAGAGFVEGAVWAAAFWIKPHIAVPALACWLATAWRARTRLGRVAVDGAAVLLGGLTVGGLGVAWLVGSGAWPDFVEIVLVWNREYIVSRPTAHIPDYWAYFVERFRPWIAVHLVAVPLAIVRLLVRPRADEGPEAVRLRLAAAFYLGWLIQASLQHPFDYVHVPGVLLGLAYLLADFVDRDHPLARWVEWSPSPDAGTPTAVVLARLALCVFLFHCLTYRGVVVAGTRLKVWDQCWREGSTPELRDRVDLLSKVNWTQLAQVANFLRTQNVKDGELTCFNGTTIPLYTDLNVRPSSRYTFLQNALTGLPSQRRRIFDELSASRQRFAVFETEFLPPTALQRELARPADSTLDEGAPRVVFRTQWYAVVRLDGAATPAWLAPDYPP